MSGRGIDCRDLSWRLIGGVVSSECFIFILFCVAVVLWMRATCQCYDVLIPSKVNTTGDDSNHMYAFVWVVLHTITIILVLLRMIRGDHIIPDSDWRGLVLVPLIIIDHHASCIMIHASFYLPSLQTFSPSHLGAPPPHVSASSRIHIPNLLKTLSPLIMFLRPIDIDEVYTRRRFQKVPWAIIGLGYWNGRHQTQHGVVMVISSWVKSQSGLTPALHINYVPHSF